MRHSWNNKDIKLGVRTLTHSILSSITLMQPGFGLSKWWVASLVSPVSPQSSISSVFVKQNFIAFGSTMKLSHSGVVLCFLQTSCCIHLVVLPRNLREVFCFTTEYYKKHSGNVFLTSDSAAMESTDGEVNEQWNLGGILHCMCSFYLWD